MPARCRIGAVFGFKPQAPLAHVDWCDTGSQGVSVSGRLLHSAQRSTLHRHAARQLDGYIFQTGLTDGLIRWVPATLALSLYNDEFVSAYSPMYARRPTQRDRSHCPNQKMLALQVPARRRDKAKLVRSTGLSKPMDTKSFAWAWAMKKLIGLLCIHRPLQTSSPPAFTPTLCDSFCTPQAPFNWQAFLQPIM